jgi:hypothetical protein
MHKQLQAAAAAAANGSNEPPDVPDKPLAGVARVQGIPCQAARVVQTDSENPLDLVPAAAIPGVLWAFDIQANYLALLEFSLHFKLKIMSAFLSASVA